MTPTLNGLILALLLSATVFIAACGGPSPANSNTAANSNSPQTNSNAARTNVEELGMLVNVPYESEEVFWKDDASHKRIVAVLRFPQGESNRLIADAEKIRPAQNVSVNTESWFPQELIAQSEMTGDDTLNGKSYSANAFYQDAFNDGRIIRINDTDYFVLELNAK
jgi:ABC-type Fe3+-hydroxamate transport system substrate-binding protein